ncbi:MAG: mechanosensitive ion channel [Bacteroidota bacterium]|nr:mechanosensitive ion channel [Bacteroidota bacterium]MDX5446971.1 mechanosensitive ion channel [Bacteroidota bacterium]MDX5505446.1 mechanosensitive ion channel [Bacteroidota bacterium]
MIHLLILEIFDKETLREINQKAVDFAFSAGPKLLMGLATLVIGHYLIRLLKKIIKKAFRRYRVDASLSSFLMSLIVFLLYTILLIAVASTLGVATSSFLTILGAMGLAIGLALQGSLSNFAGGVLILLFKPFKVGDIVEINTRMGTVEKIDILHTTLVLFDNRVVTMPNGPVANNEIINFTRKKERRVQLDIGIAYRHKVGDVRPVILNILKQDERILNEPEPVVKLNQLADSSLNLVVRFWTSPEDYFESYWDNLERIKDALDEHGYEIPFPQRTVTIVQKPSGSAE